MNTILFLLSLFITIFNHMVAAKYILVDVDVPARQSHTEKIVPPTVIPEWRTFQGGAVLDVRGFHLSSFLISVNPLSVNANYLAQVACRRACEKTKTCCMQCTKPMWEIVRGGYTKGYACTLYDAKFGGTSDKEIESLSRSSYDDCAFKDKLRACMNPRKPPM